jgi:RNA polymerase sigma-70 factor (ECF subfamily)
MARLIELDQASLFHFMVRRLGNSEDAADATQEAVRRVLVSLATLRNPAAYRGWLYRIALNVVQDMARSRQTERSLVLKMTHSGSPSRGEQMPDTKTEDLRDRVRAAVNGLEGDLRATVVLRYEQGLSYEEIAGAMQTPAGTVAKRLHTAHQRLQQVLAGAGASVALGSLTEALEATKISPIPRGIADTLNCIVLESPLPRTALRVPLVTTGSSVLVALVLVGIGGVLVYWKGRGSPPLTSAAQSLTPKMNQAMSGQSGFPGLRETEARQGSLPPASFPGRRELASLTGFIRDQDTHLPIAGAQVWIADPHLSPPSRISAVTGQDGSYSIEGPPSTYFIDVLAPGYVRYNFERIIHIHRLQIAKDKAASDQVGSLLEVRLEEGRPATRSIDLVQCAEIRGLVVDPRGNPLPGADILLENQDFNFTSASQQNQLSISYEPDGDTNQYVADFRGAFRISHLHPGGTCSLKVTHKGFATLRGTIALIRPQVETQLVLQDGMQLGGKVFNDRGEAIRNACLLVGISGSNQMLRSPDRSTAEGTYLLTDQLPETFFIAAYAPGYGPAIARIEGSDPRQIPLVLPEAAHRVFGLIVDDSGQPLGGVSASVHHYDVSDGKERARIVFVDEQGNGSTGQETGRPSGFLPQSCRPPQSRSQADGYFELERIALTSNLSAGLHFEKTGYELLEQSVSDSGFLEIRMTRKAQK